MDLEDLLAARDVGAVDQDMAVKAAGPQQRRVERFGAVGRGDHDHTVVGVEAIHFDQQRVEGLFPFVVTPERIVAAAFAKGIQFVDEDDAGRAGDGLLEHIANPCRSHADEHFDEIAPREPVERHARFAGDGLGQQRLAGPWGADQQHASGYPTAELLVLFGVLEEIDDLIDLFDRLVDPGDLVERDRQVFLAIQLATASREGHR